MDIDTKTEVARTNKLLYNSS